jgi:hypothetical protein
VLLSINHPSVTFRKSVVEKVGNYRDLQPYEDHDLWFRVGLLAEIANLPRPLLQYRKHPASETARANPDYFIYFRMVAEVHRDSLFHGLTGAEALALRQKSTRDAGIPVWFSDLRKYRQAAIDTACHLGKPRDYFTATRAYQENFRELLRNYVRQHRIGRGVIQLKRLLSGGTAVSRS